MNKKITKIIQVIVSLIFLFIVLRRANWIQIKNVLESVKAAPVFWFIFCMLGIQICQIIRWFFLLKPKKSVSLKKLVYYQLIGNFFQLFLPSTAGADIVKAYYLDKEEAKNHGYSSVIIGRMAGLWTTIGIFVVCILYRPEIIGNRLSFLIASFVIFCSLLITFLFFSKKLTAPLREKLDKLSSSKILSRIKDIRESIYLYRNQYSIIGASIIISMILYAFMVLSNCFVFTALNHSLPLSSLAVYIPVIYLLTLIPVSFNGIGVREYFYLLFFSTYGITIEVIISVSILIYTFNLVIGLTGGMLWIIKPQQK